jgi:hypothetical protein
MCNVPAARRPQAALEEDASVFDYDGVYDDIAEQRSATARVNRSGAQHGGADTLAARPEARCIIPRRREDVGGDEGRGVFGSGRLDRSEVTVMMILWRDEARYIPQLKRAAVVREVEQDRIYERVQVSPGPGVQVGGGRTRAAPRHHHLHPGTRAIIV